MRAGRQGTQAVHNFIPKPGIFLSAPTNATSGLIVAEEPGEGPIGEGPGGDFPEPPPGKFRCQDCGRCYKDNRNNRNTHKKQCKKSLL